MQVSRHRLITFTLPISLGPADEFLGSRYSRTHPGVANTGTLHDRIKNNRKERGLCDPLNARVLQFTKEL